jgi:hypothetical protein
MVVVLLYFCRCYYYHAGNAGLKTMVLAVAAFCGNYLCQGNADHVTLYLLSIFTQSFKVYVTPLLFFASKFFLGAFA